MLNKNINLFDKRFNERADKDFTSECDYMKCDYKCVNSSKTKKSNIDTTTMVESFIKEDIELIVKMTSQDGWCKHLDRENKNKSNDFF